MYILSQRISGDFMNTKDIHYIDFISFKVKCLNVLYACAHFNRSEIGIFRIGICKPSLAKIPKVKNYWLCGTNFQVFLLRYS